MGCTTSKASRGSVHFINPAKVDDSIHAMLEREMRVAKTRGETPKAYRPRDPHPLLTQQRTQKTIVVTEEDDDDDNDPDERSTASTQMSASVKNDEKVSKEEVDHLLWHTEHHCDTIDERDVQQMVRR